MEDFYLVLVSGGTEISTEGPFPTWDQLAEAARTTWAKAKPEYDSLFFLTAPRGAAISVGEFSNAQLEDDEWD